MVSASTGALLVPHVRSGSGRLALLLGCYCLFMFATIASAVVIAMIGRRLLAGGLSFGEIRPASMMDIGPAPMVPTWWIVLGPLGQSITALGLLGGVAHDAVPVPVATALHWCGILYGVPVWCGAIAWIPVAAAFTLRTARTGLPFSLTWWSFVFPVATTVTGSSGLASHTGLSVFRFAAILLFIALLAAGIVVGSKTVQGSYRGRLFKPPVGS
jgi:tellurite resistance protein TehA-like permease